MALSLRFLIQLRIGELLLPNKATPIAADDKILNYSSNIVQMGLLLVSLLDVIKVPDRDRCLRLMKLALLYFRGHNTRSKYSYEIVRLLVHQYYTLSCRRAHEEFYGLSVNTHGNDDSHIPCDLQMEYVVKEIKWNIKHMGSGQNEEAIQRRTADSGLNDISKNYDDAAAVIRRYQSHGHVTDIGDKLEMLACVSAIKPFETTSGRCHRSFRNIKRSAGQVGQTSACEMATTEKRRVPI